jgi:hypothetical protein
VKRARAIAERDTTPSNDNGVDVVRRATIDPLKHRELVTFLSKLVEERRRSGGR